MLIHQIAEKAGMSKDGIRHYEEMGLIISTPRQAGSRTYRDYDASVLETIEKIRQAQQLGFTLKEIGPLLKAHDAKALTREQTVAFLQARQLVIQEKIKALREVEAFIERKVALYQATTESSISTDEC
jgi:DNA-binding transcriptional MerR regulator